MGRHLGIVFFWFLVDFCRQVGEENGAKIDPRRHRKSDGKMEATKMARRSTNDALTTRGGGGPEPWGGPPRQGGPNPWGRRSGPPGLAWPSGKAFKT